MYEDNSFVFPFAPLIKYHECVVRFKPDVFFSSVGGDFHFMSIPLDVSVLQSSANTL